MNHAGLVLRSVLGGLAVLGGLSLLPGNRTAVPPAVRPTTVAAPLLVAPRQHPPRHPGPRFSTSQNWAGYAAYNQTNVRGVQGTWTVPAASYGLNCAGTTYSSTWVGIDGYSDGTVEQLGTEQDWTNGSGGSASYYAWWEMYPHPAYYVTLNGKIAPVKANDSITAKVTYNNNNSFTLYMTNNTQGWSFTTTQKMPSAKRTSAEWIEEAPFSGGIVPLADFGTVNFTSCLAAINSPTLSTPLFSCSPLDPITMADSNGNPQTTAPTPAASDGFSLQWLSCQ
jgi:Peptidase A4 family